ncbi:hypothetical protein BZA77DRAFT_295478 [Pyronema omphalodes]|nr:hypothetical protein BZA77DRAFT_295478 [Pyronema omphalodes]
MDIYRHSITDTTTYTPALLAMLSQILGPNFWTLPMSIFFDTYTGEGPSDQVKVNFWGSLHPSNLFDYYFQEIYNYSGIPAINRLNVYFFTLGLFIFTYLLRDKLNFSCVSKTLDDILAIGILFPLRVLVHRSPQFFSIAIDTFHNLINNHVGHITNDWTFEPAQRRPDSESGMSLHRIAADLVRIFAEILSWAYFLAYWALKILVLSLYACTDWIDNLNARARQEREWREEIEVLEREYLRHGFGPLPTRLPPPPRYGLSWEEFWALFTRQGISRKITDIRKYILRRLIKWMTSSVEEVHVYRDVPQSPPRYRGATVRGTRREIENRRAVELDRHVRSLEEQIVDVRRRTEEEKKERQQWDAMPHDREAMDAWDRMERELEAENERELQEARLRGEHIDSDTDDLFGDDSD